MFVFPSTPQISCHFYLFIVLHSIQTKNSHSQFFYGNAELLRSITILLKPLEFNPPHQQNIRFTGELKDLPMIPRVLTDISFSKGDCCFIRMREDHREISRNVYFADLSCGHSFQNLLSNIMFDVHLPTYPRDPP